jgi:predicted transcriptional regulator
LVTRTWKSVRTGRLTPDATARVAKRAREQIQEATLKELRHGMDFTQAEVAVAAEMTQSELSRLEKRADHRISTLRRYVEAMGGTIEILANFGGHRVKLTDV